MSGARDIVGVVVMHFDNRGELSVHVADPAGRVVVLTVDDRCPDDRVYEHTFRQEPTDVLALAPRPWGHDGDDRHGQATARVLFAQHGLREVGIASAPQDGAPHNPQPQDDEG